MEMSEDSDNKNRIKKLHVGEAVHAKITQDAGVMRDLIGLEIGQGQSSMMDDVSLSADVSFGKFSFRYVDEIYTIYLKQAKLTLKLENANVIAGTAYERKLQSGSFGGEKTLERTRQGQVTTTASVSGKATASTDGSVCASAEAQAKIDGRAELNGHAKEFQKTSLELPFVVRSGQNSWNIGVNGGDGIPDGDPRTPNHALAGVVISASEGENLTPLVKITVDEASKSIQGRMSLSINSYKIDREVLLESEKGQVLKFPEEFKKDLQEEFYEFQSLLQNIIKKENGLRSRMALKAAAKGAHKEIRDEIGSDLILACRSFIFEPEKKDEEN
jgi:hypothetical protein